MLPADRVAAGSTAVILNRFMRDIKQILAFGGEMIVMLVASTNDLRRVLNVFQSCFILFT